jgi:hypothetical protein
MLATLGLSFLQKSFGQFSAPPFSLSPNGKKLPPKERKEKQKKKPKKTIIPTIGFGKIEGLVSQPQNPKHLGKKFRNLFFLM